MKYKVGDSVFIKGYVVDTDEGTKLDVKIKLDSGETEWFASEEVKSYTDKTYEQGLEDAWELLEKMWVMDYDKIYEIFEVSCATEVFRDYTPQEALAKLKAYEEESEIKVGDVVEMHDPRYKDSAPYMIKGCVIGMYNNKSAYVLEDNGDVEEWECKKMKKTGKHIDIASLLVQIREEQHEQID